MKGEKMETDIQDLMAWQKDAERELSREAERLEEKGQRIGGLMKVLEATEEILAENSSLREELERKAKEMNELRRQLQEASSQHQESDSRAQTMEIHNHFEAGSNSQVYNEKVTGKFTYPNDNNNNNNNNSNNNNNNSNSSNKSKNKNKKNKKKEQKKWKKRSRKA